MGLPTSGTIRSVGTPLGLFVTDCAGAPMGHSQNYPDGAGSLFQNYPAGADLQGCRKRHCGTSLHRSDPLAGWTQKSMDLGDSKQALPLHPQDGRGGRQEDASCLLGTALHTSLASYSPTHTFVCAVQLCYCMAVTDYAGWIRRIR